MLCVFPGQGKVRRYREEAALEQIVTLEQAAFLMPDVILC